MKDYIKDFETQREENIRAMGADADIDTIRQQAMRQIGKHSYTYNFTWMGRPIIQFPEDIICMQEAIMHVRPDLIIETGVAHGGSAVFYASMLELLGDTQEVTRQVVAIEIDLRAHNREALDNHPMRRRIKILEGSSTDPSIIAQVNEIASHHKIIMVTLDSMHTHGHVYNELNAYAPLVSTGSYIVVFDTIIESVSDMDFLPQRPWGKGNNPHTAVKQWLGENDNFICDETYNNKAFLSSNPGGWLLRVR